MSKKLTTEEFIARARKVHGDKYDYSKVEYKNRQTKVCIICPRHGEFWQTPHNHLKGRGCPGCGKERAKKSIPAKTTEQFMTEARSVHGNKYDYSKVEYKNNQTKICIVCPRHGEFWQAPGKHLAGQGCPRCNYEKSANVLSKPVEQFIAEARAVHGNKYDYSKVEYKNNKTKVCIICPRHGKFWQRPSGHLGGNGCPECSSENSKELFSFNTEKFVTRARSVHGDKYDYSKAEYKNAHAKVKVFCPKHGPFWVTPANHLYHKSGCPRCATRISKPEQEIADWVKSKLEEIYGVKVIVARK